MSTPTRTAGLESLIGRERDEALQAEVAAAMRESVETGREVHAVARVVCRGGRVVDVRLEVSRQRRLGV